MLAKFFGVWSDPLGEVLEEGDSVSTSFGTVMKIATINSHTKNSKLSLPCVVANASKEQLAIAGMWTPLASLTKILASGSSSAE